MYHIFSIHSFADRHLGCFQHLAIVNGAAMNIGVHRFFWIGVSGLLGYNPSSGIAGSKGSFIFSFLRKFHTWTVTLNWKTDPELLGEAGGRGWFSNGEPCGHRIQRPSSGQEKVISTPFRKRTSIFFFRKRKMISLGRNILQANLKNKLGTFYMVVAITLPHWQERIQKEKNLGL